MKFIDEIELKDKKVFMRVDFNCPLDAQSQITDDTRIRRALPTLQYALEKGAKVILASHLGRPKGVRNLHYSLLPVAERLAELTNHEVLLAEDCIGDGVKKLGLDLREGQILMLENLRFHPEEEKNDDQFSAKLAALADVYINEAFGTLHRAHASTVGMVPLVKEYGAGFLVKKEVEYLTRLVKDPERPFLAILGGAKVSDKIGVIENLLNLVDGLLVGGAMAFTFLKSQGYKVGNSLVEEGQLKVVDKIWERAKLKGISLHLPQDHVMAAALELPETKKLSLDRNIQEGYRAFDIGPKTIALFSQEIAKAKTILWNGPMGVFEKSPYAQGTLQVAQAVGDNLGLKVVAGGDSVAAINQLGLQDKISHLSTGGGATLEFLEGKVLPGIKALES